MALTYQLKTVTVSIPDTPDAWENVQVEYLNITAGARYGTCRLSFPEAYAFHQIPQDGQQITVKVAGQIIFSGRVIAYPGGISPETERQTLLAADVRWEMRARRIGQYGVGPQNADDGGWPEVGYQIVFNPAGRGNRSADPDENGVYTFFSGPGAQKWTRAQILKWTHWWYVKYLIDIDFEALSLEWNEAADTFAPYLASATSVIRDLAALCGESWGLNFATVPPRYVSIRRNPSTEVVIDLPAPEAGANVQQSTEKSAVFVVGGRSIENSVDRVEVHARRFLVEHTHTNLPSDDPDSDGSEPLLIGFVPDDPDYAYGWRIDVTQYESHKLGYNLTDGCRPKPWLRWNVSTMRPAADLAGAGFYEADDENLLAGLGTRIRPEQCIWMRELGGGDWYRVRSSGGGITILLREGIILARSTIAWADSGYGSMTPASESAWEDVKLKITLTTEIELNRIVKSVAPPAWHIDADHVLREALLRSDIQPVRRYKSTLPDISSTDLNATTLAAWPGGGDPDELELYIDETDDLFAIGEQLLAARQPREVTFSVRTLDFADDIVLGKLLRISPSDPGLSGAEVIYSIVYEASAGDRMEISATNNFSDILRL